MGAAASMLKGCSGRGGVRARERKRGELEDGVGGLIVVWEDDGNGCVRGKD